VDDVMPQIVWCKYFMEAQGYDLTGNTVLQDNQSAMLLEKNGKLSSSKRTRHINIRYFFVTDRVEKNELNIEYCPTEQMIGDFFTKPLQGWKFKKFRDLIMNCTEEDISKKCNKTKIMVGPKTMTYKDALIGPQECVGEKCERTDDKGKVSKKVRFQDHAGSNPIGRRPIGKILKGMNHDQRGAKKSKFKCFQPGLVSILRPTSVEKQISSKREGGRK